MKISAIPKLMRLENCAMAGLAVLIGFIVASGGLNFFGLGASVLGLVLAFVSAFLITGAGNTINDYYDRKTDKKNAPHRPIPSNEISARGAFVFAIALFGVGIVMSFFINYECLGLAGFNSVVLFFYGRNLKSSVFAGNVAVSYLTGSTFVYGALVLQNPVTTVFLALLAFLANVGREIIGDVEDIGGDVKAGMRTFATKYGEKKAWFYGRIYIISAVILSPLPYLAGLLGIYYLVMVMAANGLFVASVITCDARRNQKLTKIAIFAGLVAFLVGALL
jgi:geranylgeranylglycerol-phosphate geranylgeranyltransferase